MILSNLSHFCQKISILLSMTAFLNFKKLDAAICLFFWPHLFGRNFCLKQDIEISKVSLETLKQWQKLILLFQKCQTSIYGSKVRCWLSEYLWVTLYYNLSEPFSYSKNVKKGHINFFSYSTANKPQLFSKTKPRFIFFIFDNWPIGMVGKSCWVAKNSYVGNLNFFSCEKKNILDENYEKKFFGDFYFLLKND